MHPGKEALTAPWWTELQGILSSELKKIQDAHAVLKR